MLKRPDINQIAASIVAQTTGEETPTLFKNAKRKNTTADIQKQNGIKPRNAAAVALGRLGGLKGGRARAQKLSKEERVKIAKKAALSRWKNKSS